MKVPALVTLVSAMTLLPVQAALAQDGATTRVSVMTGCGKSPIGLGHSTQPAISDDGRVIAFSSNATTLVQGNATIAWFANLGGGSFGPIQVITTELDEPTAIAAALVDGDGFLDVLTTSKLDDRLAWYANDLLGSSVFDGPIDITTTLDAATGLASGDMDGDADVDVLAVSPDAETTSWWPNDGGGAFGSPVPIFPYGRNRSVFPADMDGDGDLDVLHTVDFETGEIAWQENRDGAGSFCPEHPITTAADGAWGVHAADLDGDGDLDVISSSSGAPTGPRLQWFANLDGQGTFGAPAIVSTAATPTAVGAGDLDGDGDRDLVAGYDDDHRVAWFENLDGVGNFGSAIVLDANVATPSSVEVVDLDLDGDVDVLYSSNGLGEVAWFRNTDGQGTFAAKTVIGSSLALAKQARAADVDADGDLDVLAAVAGLDQVCWFRNLGGASSFSAKLVISSQVGAHSVAAIDVDADGRLDVLSTSYNEDKVSWHRNTNGLGSFAPAQTISVTSDGAHSVVGVDLDADGDGDVVSFGHVENQATWYDNTNGLGTAFVAHDLAPAAGFPAGRQVVAADIDGDGDPDLLSAGGWLGDVCWYENPDGQAGFGEKHSIMTNTKSPRCVHGADIDGDGDVDALSASFNDDKIAWSRNLDGQGTFGPQLVISTTVDGARWVTTGDVDGDGDLDVLATAELENRVSWFENVDGAGTFGTERTLDTPPQPHQAQLADLDDDGDLDGLVVSFGDDATAWLENDGTGLSFVRHAIHDGPTVGATAAATADVDGDGDLDVLVAAASPGPMGREVYVHDRHLLTTTWVSHTLTGAPADAQHPALSADGRYVAFESPSPHVVAGPDTNVLDVYLRDVETDSIERIDVSTAGAQANNVSVAPSVSGDGRYVAFESYANNLVAGDLTCCSGTDVFLRDRLTGTTIRVNERPDATPPDGAAWGVVSTDGQSVAFVSSDSALVPGDTNGDTDVFLRNIATGVITRVSLAGGGVEIIGGNNQQPTLSADARFVAFRTHANLDPADDNGLPDVYVHDRQSLATTWASVTSTGGAASNPCEEPRISADGRYVSFVSRATDLVPGTTVPNVLRGYRRDMQTGTTELMSIASDGTQANAGIGAMDLSGDGSLVSFDSLADNLVASDTDDVSDVFVHGIDPWFPLGCDEPGGGGAPLLMGSGPLAGGTAGKLALSNAKRSSLSMLFVSLQSVPAAFKGGVLVANPAILQVLLPIGPAGALNLNFTWPGGLPGGVQLFFHWAIADPEAEFGVALSSALRAVTP